MFLIQSTIKKTLGRLVASSSRPVTPTGHKKRGRDLVDDGN
jgi:hypothetical protein